MSNMPLNPTEAPINHGLPLYFQIPLPELYQPETSSMTSSSTCYCGKRNQEQDDYEYDND